MLEFFDAAMLARIQFAFTVSFHIIFPSFSIGLASYLFVLEGLWLKTKKPVYLNLYKYWLKIFAVAFGMGVVSGLVMSYQFGTNWSVFSDKAGPVIGPLLAYEVLSAFFLEAGFLGIMLFGMEKVGKRLHFFATSMVAFGTLLSATWILSVNSWMQTPVGHAMNDLGQFVPVDWLAIIFNPSFPYRMLHMTLASYLTVSFVVGGVGAWHLLRNNKNMEARKMFSMAMWMATLVAPIQIFAGDLHGLNTIEHQPNKVAAMEGHWHRQTRPAFILAWPDEEREENRFELGIPYASALVLTHKIDGETPGLTDVPASDRPPVGMVFWSFRVMILIGTLMALIGVYSAWLRWKGRLYDVRWFQRVSMCMGPSGFVAVLAGWIVTEVGRQPFTVYGLSSHQRCPLAPVDAPAVGASLLAFIVVYFALFGAGTYYILRMMRTVPDGEGPKPGTPLRAAGTTPVASMTRTKDWEE